MTLREFVSNYKHTIEDLEDCYFYKIEIGNIRFNIQEDKNKEFHFMSIIKDNISVFAGWSEDINSIIKDIKDYIKENM